MRWTPQHGRPDPKHAQEDHMDKRAASTREPEEEEVFDI